MEMADKFVALQRNGLGQKVGHENLEGTLGPDGAGVIAVAANHARPCLRQKAGASSGPSADF